MMGEKVEKCSDQEKKCLKLTAHAQDFLEEKNTKTLPENQKILAKIHEATNQNFAKMDNFIKSQEQKIDDYYLKIAGKLDKIPEITQIWPNFKAEFAKIENDVKEKEGCVEENKKILEVMEEVKRRVGAIRNKLPSNKPAPAGFENSDPRIGDVYSRMTQMIESLPLSENEHCEMDVEIENVANNADLDGKGKVEMVALHLLALMSSWDQQTSRSVSSSNWQSVPPNQIVLSDWSLNDNLDDSNLADLDGLLRTARIRQAMSPRASVDTWSTASILSDRSDSGSIYTLLPASSLSAHTAYSQDTRINTVPPRSTITNSIPEPATGTLTSASNASLAFSSISLREMIGDALSAAKNIAETQAGNVLETLQKTVVGNSTSFSDEGQSAGHAVKSPH